MDNYDKSSSNLNYFIKKSNFENNQIVELSSTKRLQFEPKSWMEEMKKELQVALKQITPIENGILYTKFCTNDHDSMFDVENVLLYNVGSGAFSRIGSHHLIIERSLEKLPIIYDNCSFNHYHQYNYGQEINYYWDKYSTLVIWSDMKLTSLKEKPHEYWLQAKNSNIEIYDFHNKDNNIYGLKINIGIPHGRKVNLSGICKPLIDGIVSSFQYYEGDDLAEVSKRLSNVLNKDKTEISNLLIERTNTILGSSKLIRRFKEGIQWNPADDSLYQIELKTYESDRDDWIIDGELYTCKR